MEKKSEQDSDAGLSSPSVWHLKLYESYVQGWKEKGDDGAEAGRQKGDEPEKEGRSRAAETSGDNHAQELLWAVATRELSEKTPLGKKPGWPFMEPSPGQWRLKETEEMDGAMVTGVYMHAPLLRRVWLFVTQWRELQPARPLCPWAFPGKNTGVSCQFLLQTAV